LYCEEECSAHGNGMDKLYITPSVYNIVVLGESEVVSIDDSKIFSAQSGNSSSLKKAIP
jgi:hypothetical protein